MHVHLSANNTSRLNKFKIVVWGSSLAIMAALTIIATTVYLSTTTQIVLYSVAGITPLLGWVIWRALKECYLNRLKVAAHTIRIKNEPAQWLNHQIHDHLQSHQGLNYRKEWGHECVHLHNEIEKHIYAVLNNVYFQADLNGYMAMWAKKIDHLGPNDDIEFRQKYNHPELSTSLRTEEKTIVECKAFVTIAPYVSLSNYPAEFRKTMSDKAPT